MVFNAFKEFFKILATLSLLCCSCYEDSSAAQPVTQSYGIVSSISFILWFVRPTELNKYDDIVVGGRGDSAKPHSNFLYVSLPCVCCDMFPIKWCTISPTNGVFFAGTLSGWTCCARGSHRLDFCRHSS